MSLEIRKTSAISPKIAPKAKEKAKEEASSQLDSYAVSNQAFGKYSGIRSLQTPASLLAKKTAVSDPEATGICLRVNRLSADGCWKDRPAIVEALQKITPEKLVQLAKNLAFQSLPTQKQEFVASCIEDAQFWQKQNQNDNAFKFLGASLALLRAHETKGPERKQMIAEAQKLFTKFNLNQVES